MSLKWHHWTGKCQYQDGGKYCSRLHVSKMETFSLAKTRTSQSNDIYCRRTWDLWSTHPIYVQKEASRLYWERTCFDSYFLKNKTNKKKTLTFSRSVLHGRKTGFIVSSVHTVYYLFSWIRLASFSIPTSASKSPTIDSLLARFQVLDRNPCKSPEHLS